MASAKSMKSKVFAAVVACLLAGMVAVPVKALADVQTNYSWYKGHESNATYMIGTAGEMKALACLVNGTADYDGDGTVDAAVSFEGKTIVLSEGASVNFLGEAIEPIGTADHPFQGTFDGSVRQVDNFNLVISAKSTQAVTNIGLFGYVGDQGSLVGVSVGPRSSISITRNAKSTDYIANVGLVVGFCAGTITDCSNAGALTVTSEVVQQSAEQSLPVRNIGGVAGQCIFDVKGCSNTGTIKVSQLSSPVADFDKAQLAGFIGGVVGLLGDETRVGDAQTHIFGEADKHGSIDNCTNTGVLDIDTPKVSGLDRFGQQTSAESMLIGGIVGYSQGSITNCVNGRAQSIEMGANGQNVGYIRAENGVTIGGICGSLRGVRSDVTTTAWADDGADGNDPLVISHCVNYGDVYGRATVGGIVGKTSSYTTVTECLNMYKLDYFGNQVETFVVGTRWNKPGPGGIVGTANGNVSYCANFGTIASAKWTDEATRTYMTMDGYYAAGIAGFLVYFGDQAPSHGGISTPISEVYSCYNAGSIIAGSNMRQRGIVGENDGYTHDNVLVAGLVYNDEVVYGDSADETEASGAVGENRVYDAADLRGDKAAEAIAFMNANSQANGWQRYWLVPEDSTKKGLNLGYPLLDSQNPWGDRATLITGAKVSLAANAQYTGGESLPSANVVLNGKRLVENADYRVVPQAGAVNPSQGGAYSATIVGLGRYQGTASQKLAYDVVSGDFSVCLVTAVAHTFDYEGHVPSADDVTVRTPAGTVVDPGEYTFWLVDENGDKIGAPVNAGTYRLVAEPVQDSKLFHGTVEGTFRIKQASLMRDIDYDKVSITYLGEEYPWVDSTVKGESDNPSTTLRYTGVAVKPVVGEITYKGHTLVEGTDYRVVYGNSNSDDGYPDDQDEYNMGKPGGTSIGCVTVRSVTGQKTNYSNYANMFFNIVDDGSKTDLALATYEVPGDQISDGRPLEPVELYLGKTKLVEGADYTITYRNNVHPGTASFTATGIGGFAGSLSGEFTILEGDSYELYYAFAGSGTAGDPYEATVTGVAYLSSRATFDLVIPASVDHEGNEYAVTAIGASAFGGTGASDFEGSVQNESKLKVATVSIPATVRTIGANAFGTSSITMAKTLPLSSVTIAPDSQLVSIGAYAFAKCRNLANFTVPERVEEIGDGAFLDCNALTEMRFLTEQANLPSTLGKKTFGNCANVVVRGFADAVAVKQIASDNAGSTAGANGGKGFTFSEIASLKGATVSAIANQVYTGSAIEPDVVVTLGKTRLVEGTDYALSYADNVDAGTARVIVTGIGDRGSSAISTFTIEPAKIARASYSRVSDQQYTGEPVDITAELTFNGATLKEGRDYTVSYADVSGATIAAPSNVGTYRLVITGVGNFKGTTDREFRIVASSIADAVVSNVGDKVFTGAAIEPDVDVRLGTVNLVRDRDFTVAYVDNVAIGQATVHVYGIGGFRGETTLSFRIVQASVAEAAVGGVHDAQVDASGRAVAFEPVVVVNGTRLVEGSDYEWSYATSDDVMLDSAPSAVGDYRVVVRGKGNYAGSASAPFSITEAAPAAQTSIAGAMVALSPSSFGYRATACEPAMSVKLGATALVEGVDYIVAYEGNVNPGVATATAYGIGAYTGSVSAPFSVKAVALASENVLAVSDYAYTGSQVTPHLAVRVDGRSLSEGVDYSIAYGDNVNVGTGTATVTGLGGYTGQVSVRFAIVAASIAGSDVRLDSASVPYTGKKQKPAVTVTLDGRVLVEDADYTLSYATADGSVLGGAPIDAGSYQVIVMGKGSYVDSASTAFEITQAANTATAEKKSVKKTFKANAKTKKLAKAQTIALPKVKTTFGTAKWKVAKADSKKVLSLKGDKVKVKKGAKVGTYTMKVKASVKATSNYAQATTKAVAVKVTVK